MKDDSNDGKTSHGHCQVICWTGPRAKDVNDDEVATKLEHSYHFRTLGVRALGPVAYPLGAGRFLQQKRVTVAPHKFHQDSANVCLVCGEDSEAPLHNVDASRTSHIMIRFVEEKKMRDLRGEWGS